MALGHLSVQGCVLQSAGSLSHPRAVAFPWEMQTHLRASLRGQQGWQWAPENSRIPPRSVVLCGQGAVSGLFGSQGGVVTPNQAPCYPGAFPVCRTDSKSHRDGGRWHPLWVPLTLLTFQPCPWHSGNRRTTDDPVLASTVPTAPGQSQSWGVLGLLWNSVPSWKPAWTVRGGVTALGSTCALFLPPSLAGGPSPT